MIALVLLLQGLTKLCTLWFQCETRISAELAGALLTLFFAWNVAQHVQRAKSETKHSDTR